MLTAEQKQANKLAYFTLLCKLGVDLTEFSKYLDCIDFYEKPATAQTFRAYPGGLCQYALDIHYELVNLCNAYFPGRYSEETIIKVALLKDLYRAELYEAYNKNVRNDATGQWEAQLAFKTKDPTERPTFGDLGFSSYMIAKHFFNFTDEEIEAICHSNESCRVDDFHDLLRTYPLITLTKMANLVAGYLEQN